MLKRIFKRLCNVITARALPLGSKFKTIRKAWAIRYFRMLTLILFEGYFAVNATEITNN